MPTEHKNQPSAGAGGPGRPRFQDGALLLRRTAFGNSSLVVHLLTRTSGRVELVARGAYRPKSRFNGVLDWFDELDLAWVGPRGGQGDGLGELRAGDLVTRRRRITEHLPLYRAAQSMTELTEVATRTGAAGRSTSRSWMRGWEPWIAWDPWDLTAAARTWVPWPRPALLGSSYDCSISWAWRPPWSNAPSAAGPRGRWMGTRKESGRAGG